MTFPSSANDICPFQRPFHDEHWIQHVFSGIAVDLSSRIKIPTSIVFEILLSRRRNLVRGGQFCFARAVRSVIGGAVMEKGLLKASQTPFLDTALKDLVLQPRHPWNPWWLCWISLLLVDLDSSRDQMGFVSLVQLMSTKIAI